MEENRMNYLIWLAAALLVVGIVGYYVAYFKGKKAYAGQMELYSQGIPLGLQNMQELYQALLALRYPAIKNISVGDDGCIVVEGTSRKHFFYVENGLVKIRYSYRADVGAVRGIAGSVRQMKIHWDAAAVMEANQIMDALAMEHGAGIGQKTRGYENVSVGKKILIPSFIAIILGAILLCFGISKEMMDEKNPEQYRTAEKDSRKYELVLDDAAGYFDDAEEDSLYDIMDEIANYCNIAVVTTASDNKSSTEEFTIDYFEEVFGAGANGTIFVIDGDFRIIYLYSDGDAWKIITHNQAQAIVDDTYIYATNGDYYACAYKSLEQVWDLLKKM
jgi:hypothetical protein